MGKRERKREIDRRRPRGGAKCMFVWITSFTKQIELLSLKVNMW